MPRYEITSPTGERFEITAPEGATEEQILQYARQNFPTTPSTAPPEQVGLLGRLGRDIGRRGEKVGEILGAQGLSLVGEQQTLPETGFQLGGQAAGAFGDVLANLAISGYRALPEAMRTGVEEAGGAALGVLGSLPSAGGGTIGEAVPQELSRLFDNGSYAEFQKDYPRAARNLEAAVNLGTLAAPMARATAPTAIKQTGKQLVKQSLKAIPRAKDITSQALRTQAGRIYQLADDVGGIVRSGKVSNIVDDIAKNIEVKGETLPEVTRNLLKQVDDPEGVLTQVKDVFESLKGNPLTLDGFQRIDQTLGDLAYKASTPDNVRRQVVAMQKGLRDAIENVDPGDLLGGKEGFEAYKRATELWGKQARIRTLENLTKKAFATDQPRPALQRALNRFLADEKNIRGFSAKEIDAIKQAADTGFANELLRNVVSRFPSKFAMGAGMPGLSTALTVAGTGAKSFADDLTLRQMQNISNLIARGQTAPPQVPPQFLLGARGMRGQRALGQGLQRLGGGLETLDRLRGRQALGLGLTQREQNE